MTRGHAKLEPLLLGCDEVGLDIALTQRSLYEFIKIAWQVVEPSRAFMDNWSIGAICEHLEAIQTKELTRLVINVPPGAMKSLSCAVFFPAWSWTMTPGTKFIFSSYADQVARRDSLRCRALYENPWYRARWGAKSQPVDSQWTATKFMNSAGGFRMATTVRGQVTGEHADVQVVDDPLKPLEVTGSLAVSKNALENVLMWWTETMSSRLVDFEKSARIIIMQRLHAGDLAGAMLKEAGGYEHLRLPMEYEQRLHCTTSIGFTDPRTEEGELLWPERFSPAAVEQLKHDLGPRGTKAQLQQDPTPSEGTVFMKDWLRFYTESAMPTQFGAMIQSWDATFKEAGSSYVVGQCWGVANGNYYLLGQVRKRMSFTDTCTAVKQMTVKWPKSLTKLVEAKANGNAIVDHLKSEISGFVLVEPQGGKEARAQAVEPLFAAGNVYLPDPAWQPWVSAYVEELLAFPAGSDDDQVDATTQALVYLHGKRIDRLRKAMENQR